MARACASTRGCDEVPRLRSRRAFLEVARQHACHLWQEPLTSLDDFLKAVSEAGAEASQRCEDFYERRFMEHFEDKDGVLIPKTVKVKVGDAPVDVPKFLLRSPRRAGFDRMRIEFETTIHLDGDGDDCAIRMAGHKGLLKRGTHVKACIEFVAGDGNEAIALLRDREHNSLSIALRSAQATGAAE